MLKKPAISTVCLVWALAPVYAQSPRAIDPARSVATVKVYKAGLLGGFGHNHDIQAPVQQGVVDEEKGMVELVIDARQLKVMDQELSDKDRDEVQQNMDGPKVLDLQQFPRIRFQSTSARPSGSNKWTVQGNLEIHGQTRPVTLQVERYAGLASPAARYRGSIQLRQSDFGIRPYSSIGGAIKIKDEIRIAWDIVLTESGGGGKPSGHRD
jgi:polyisoprenoid-binding protein YceI